MGGAPSAPSFGPGSELESLAHEREEMDGRSRYILIAGSTSGKSTLVETFKLKFSPSHMSDKVIQKYRRRCIETAASVVFDILTALAAELERFAPARWPAGTVQDWLHRLEVFDFCTNVPVSYADSKHADKSKVPPVPIDPVVEANERGVAIDPKAAAAYPSALMAYRLARCDAAQTTLSAFQSEFCYDFDVLCGRLLAEPCVRHWFTHFPTPMGHRRFVGIKLPHGNARRLLEERSAFLNAKWSESGEYVNDPTVAAAVQRLAQYAYRQSGGMTATILTLPSLHDSRDWVQLRFKDFDPQRGDNRAFLTRGGSHVLFPVPLDLYNERVLSTAPMSVLEERMADFQQYTSHRPLAGTKFILVFTRLDAFDAKYQKRGLPAPNEPGFEFFQPLHAEVELTPAAKRAPDAESDLVIRYIANRFRRAASFTRPSDDTPVLRVPVVALNALDARATEFVMRLAMLNDEPSAGGRWVQSFSQYMQLKKSKQPATVAAAVADIKSGESSAEHREWMTARARVYETCGGGRRLAFMSKCPFLAGGQSASGCAAASKRLQSALSKSTARAPPPVADAEDVQPIGVANHPPVPRVFVETKPPPPTNFPLIHPTGANWESATDFCQYLESALQPAVSALSLPCTHLVGVNLWIIRPPAAWSADRAVNLQFPLSFRRAVRTLLRIWARRHITQSNMYHPLCRLPRDIILRIIPYFADTNFF